MQVLLTTLNAKYIHLNLAIRLLYDLNKDCGYLHWQEFTIKQSKQEIATECSKYDIVCFSCYIWNITQTLEVCTLIKSQNPQIKILLGGPEVSYDWHDVIVHDAVDYIITGEGEIPFQQFLHHFPKVDLVPNLVYKKDGGIHYHQQQVQFDLQLYANRNPYQYDNPADLYNKICYVETSRGCPYKCEFCLASLDNKVRQLPIDTIKQQLLYLMQHGRTVKFLDRTFNIKKDFTIDMFKFILKHHQPHHVFQFEITADIVHPDIIAFINEHVSKGLFRFEIGIQTVNKQSNLAVSRKQNFSKTADIINQLKDKIEMHLDLIVGLPLDYWEDTKYSFEEVFKLYPPELQLGFLKFLKGTPVREKYEQYQYEFDYLPPYQIIQSKFLSKEELHEITIIENALEIYWNKKRTKHLLQYVAVKYSIFDFFNGLGNEFLQHHDFHKHSLQNIYDVAQSYLNQYFKDDLIAHQMLAIDYFLQFKIRPKAYENLVLNKEQQFKLIEELQLNHHQQRFVFLPISFNYEKFKKYQAIEMSDEILLFTYDGKNNPTIKVLETYSSEITY
jgi:anaerobic magnesium-protoporphyrin IX monomethyl ester cyclase